MFPINRTSIDKSLPVPAGKQLLGLLTYFISHGDAPYGTRLPSVRALAAELGLAVMTVSRAYRELQEAGLIEIRRGNGAFVARDPGRLLGEPRVDVELRRRIDDLVDEADALGLDPGDLVTMISARLQARRLKTGLRIVFVGIFEGPARAYVNDLRPALAPEDRIDVTTIDALRRSELARRRCDDCDVCLTFVHRQAEVARIIPRARLLAIKFIPSEATRLALAGLDPRSRLAAVTRFEEYIAIMRPSILQFAPHLCDIAVTYQDAPDLAAVLAGRDVVVFATGADAVAGLVGAGVRCFEYRHAPDPGEIGRLLVPYLRELRRAHPRHREEARQDISKGEVA